VLSSKHIRIRDPDEKMIMVGHEAGGVTDPVVALIDVLEGVQIILAVHVILRIQASSRSRGRSHDSLRWGT